MEVEVNAELEMNGRGARGRRAEVVGRLWWCCGGGEGGDGGRSVKIWPPSWRWGWCDLVIEVGSGRVGSDDCRRSQAIRNRGIQVRGDPGTTIKILLSEERSDWIGERPALIDMPAYT